MEISIAMIVGEELHGLSSNSYVQFSMLQICKSVYQPPNNGQSKKWTSINLPGSEIRPSMSVQGDKSLSWSGRSHHLQGHFMD